MKVHLAASGGGHLDLLRRLDAGLEAHDLTWFTTPGRAAEGLRAEGRRVRELPPLDRRNPGLANLRRSLGYALRDAPDVLVTSGAGVVLALAALQRARGVPLVFAETMARVSDSSLSGRVLARLAARSFVQWPEMAAVRPGATVCRPVLLEALRPGVAGPGEGTFVALGTHHQSFERLLERVADGVRAGALPAPVRGQVGVSSPAPLAGLEAPVEAWSTPAGMRRGIAEAAVVVCHAGAGVIAAALREGRRPLVIPRLARHDEHVDDHQEQIARKLDELGLAVWVRDAILPEHVARGGEPIAMPAWPAGMPSLGPAVAEALAALKPARATG